MKQRQENSGLLPQALQALDRLSPDQAGDFLKEALRRLSGRLGEDERKELILGLFGGDDRDKVSSMVHL